MKRSGKQASESGGKSIWKLAFAGLMSTTALTGVAAAQEDNEIIVTATKRAENVQDIPLSVQALGAATLEEHNVTSFDDYAQLLPSVSFQSFGPGQAQIFFRGISSGGDGLHVGSSPTSSVYLDDTPVTTIGNSIDIHTYDINRVEALSGPQGTLFGASSLSGVLHVVTNQPDTSAVSGAIDVGATTFTEGDPGGSVEGYLNVPMSHNAAIRVVGWYEHQGGYIDNTYRERTYLLGDLDDTTNLTVNNASQVQDNFNDVDTAGGRAALRIDLNDNWTTTTTVVGQHQQANGPFLFDPNVGDLQVHDFSPTRNIDDWGMISETINGRIANYDLVYSGSYFDRRVESDVDYSYYTVAYDQFTGSYYTYFPDGAGGFLDPTQHAHFVDDYSKQTHELRVTSPAENRLRFTAGLFYQRQTDYDQADYFVVGASSVPSDPLTPFFLIPGLGDDVFARRLQRTDIDKAVFGEVSYDVTPQLTFTVGARVFRAENSLIGYSGFYDPTDPLCLPTTRDDRPCDNVNKGFQEDGETYKASVQYHIDDDRMVYFTYATGYRPGGANRRPGIVPYESDTLDNYEIGWKSMLFDRSLRLNAAVFFEQWDNLQFAATPVGSQGVFNVYNAGAAEITGVEGEFSWLLPNHWTVSGSGTYLDSELTNDFCDFDALGNSVCDPMKAPAAPSGTELPNQPNFKGTLTARHEFTLGSWDAFVQGTVLHQTSARSFLTVEDEAAVGGTKGFTTFDFSTGLDFGDSALQFYINNAFDERGILSRNAACAPNANLCGPSARSYPITPRLIGVRVSHEF